MAFIVNGKRQKLIIAGKNQSADLTKRRAGKNGKYPFPSNSAESVDCGPVTTPNHPIGGCGAWKFESHVCWLGDFARELAGKYNLDMFLLEKLTDINFPVTCFKNG